MIEVNGAHLVAGLSYALRTYFCKYDLDDSELNIYIYICNAS